MANRVANDNITTADATGSLDTTTSEGLVAEWLLCANVVAADSIRLARGIYIQEGLVGVITFLLDSVRIPPPGSRPDRGSASATRRNTVRVFPEIRLRPHPPA